ncbi:MAG: hypothetical protein ACI4EG_03845 [Fusicatenibacter sp.]
MKKRGMQKAAALTLSAAMIVSMAACGSESEGTGGKSDVSASESQGTSLQEAAEKEPVGYYDEQTWDHLDKVTLYPSDTSTSSGQVTGYKADILAKRGLEMEVWAYSDEKTNAILASGDLPDVMYVNYDNMKTMIEGGLILNLEDYLYKMPHVVENESIQTALNYTREYKSADTGAVYGIPTQIGIQEEGEDTGRNAIKVNWKAYYAAGCPEINSVDDLIPAMKKMLEVMPVSEVDGTQCWGTILNAGSDDTYWGNMQLWYKWFGYEPDNLPYLIETDMINAEHHSILEEDRESLYYQGLKWYNECYREGVMDPDSINNERQVQKAKVETSLACMIPSGTCAGWANYRPVYMTGQKLYQENWCKPYGTDMYVVISANTKNVDAALRTVDMLADFDAYFDIWCGPEGYLWEYGEDGLVYPTEYGMEAYTTSGVEIEFDGEKRVQWLDNFIISRQNSDSYMGPDGPRPARGLDKWTEVKEITDQSEEYTQWREVFGYQNFVELLKDHDAYTLVSDFDSILSFCPQPDDSMKLTVDAIRDIVVEASWKMVYSESDEEFEKLWDKMIQDCRDLGGEDIIAWRMDELSKALEAKEALEVK